MSCITRWQKIRHLKRILVVPVNGTENVNQTSTYWEKNVTVQKAIHQLSYITQIMRVLITLFQGIVQTDPWYMRSKSTAIAKTHQCLEDGVQSYNIILFNLLNCKHWRRCIFWIYKNRLYPFTGDMMAVNKFMISTVFINNGCPFQYYMWTSKGIYRDSSKSQWLSSA